MLSLGEETGELSIDDGAEDDRDPGRNRVIRNRREVRDRPDCGVEGVLEEVTVVDEDADATEMPRARLPVPGGLFDDEIDDFLSDERVGGGGCGWARGGNDLLRGLSWEFMCCWWWG